jgi:hypothetical protein
MQPLRSDLYNTLTSQNRTYSLEELANRHKTSEEVIKVQLDRLQQEGKRLKVTEEEVSIFLQHERPLWLYAGWVGIGFILYVLFSGGIHG